MLKCCGCDKEVEYGTYNEVAININAYSFRVTKRPHGFYVFCDDCLGVTKKLKEVRQAYDPPEQKPLGIFAKLKEFFIEKQSGENNSY